MYILVKFTNFFNQCFKFWKMIKSIEIKMLNIIKLRIKNLNKKVKNLITEKLKINEN